MSAVFSDCMRYRMRLERDVQPVGLVVGLIGVNPSYADAEVNDPTINKEIGFGMVNGWRRIIKGNVFPYRATDVRELAAVKDHRLASNVLHLLGIANDVDLLVPCWGARAKLPPALRPHLESTLGLLLSTGKPIAVFGLTKDGDPKHPLFLPYSTPLMPWLQERRRV